MLEIERKYLIDPAKLPELDKNNGKVITQGYFASNPQVRIRIASANGNSQAFITVKTRADLARHEFEYTIPEQDALAMLPLCCSSITKTRHNLYIETLKWEIDQFHGELEGLWLAELEIPTIDYMPITLPAWILLDVTDNEQYKNEELSKLKRLV